MTLETILTNLSILQMKQLEQIIMMHLLLDGKQTVHNDTHNAWPKTCVFHDELCMSSNKY